MTTTIATRAVTFQPRLEHAQLGPQDWTSATSQPAPDLPRRLLEQLASGAIWGNATSWARNTKGSFLDLGQAATAAAGLELLRRWVATNAIGYRGAADDTGMWQLGLLGPGCALLAGCWEIPAEDGLL